MTPCIQRFTSAALRSLAAFIVVGLTACAAVPPAEPVVQAPRVENPPLLVVVDKDTIATAFAAYRGAVPIGSKTDAYRAFIDQLTASLQQEAKAAGYDAKVQVVSLRALKSNDVFGSGIKEALFIRAVSYRSASQTVKVAAAGKKAATSKVISAGWTGDTTWDFGRFEQLAPNQAYRKTWVGGLKRENLSPKACGNYESCSRQLASKAFAQMRNQSRAVLVASR
jgi:hypothetical protein